MLSVWDSWSDLNRLERELRRNAYVPRASLKTARAEFVPPVDVHEEKDALVVVAELPGIKREDVEISIEKDVLTLKGQRAQAEEQENRRYHRVERNYGAFLRQFQLPTSVDAEKVEAKLADGILTVRLPIKEVLKARRIEVNGN